MKNIFRIVLIITYCIIITVSLTSCDNETPGLQSQPGSEPNGISNSKIPSQLSSESSKPNISGKGDLWADRKLKVGLVGPGAAGEWSLVLNNNLKTKAWKWNIDLYQNSDPARMGQIYSIDKFIEDEMDIIALYTYNYYSESSWDEELEIYNYYSWDEVLKKARKAGIPVILLDRRIYCEDESLWEALIVNDYYKQGEMAGEWLIDYLEKEERIDKEIKIAELRGTEGSYEAQEIGNGFKETIKDYSNIDITISKDGYFLENSAYEEMLNILSETTDIDVLFCHNDEMAIGAIEAIEEAGLVPGEDIIIVSILGTNAALEAIVEGKIACSVECNPFMGDLFMEACVRLANGEEIEREIHPVDRVFDITNAQAELDARKENGYGY